MPTQEKLNSARESLERMQQFDIGELQRAEDLGRNLDFKDAMEPARRLVDLYKRLSLSVLPDFPDSVLDQLKRQSDADFNRFKQVLDFSPSVSNPVETRNQLIQQIQAAYDGTFNSIWQHIAYGVSKATDAQRLENEARAVMQSITDKATKLTSELESSRDAAKTALDEVRRVAAEQGVSQQAVYFRDEADKHTSLASTWQAKVVRAAWVVGGYAALTIIAGYIPWLQPENNYQAVQLVTSKLLLFGVLAYLLGLSARNFMAHSHNEVVNKHRQNALLTFTALVEAGGDERSKDVILTHAAACIFSPQDTGYTKGGSHGDSRGSPAQSVVEVLPRLASSSIRSES
jgi:hypothetical protein